MRFLPEKVCSPLKNISISSPIISHGSLHSKIGINQFRQYGFLRLRLAQIHLRNPFQRICRFQSFVNAVRATGGNNAQRNLIISPYAAASGSGNWNTHLQDPLKQLTLPTDQAAHHLAVEVHDYKDMTKLQAAKNEVDEEISIWKQYFLSRGVPVIVGEWGASQNEDYSIYQKYRSNLLSYARYFVEKTKAAGIATLYWMGLSDGTARSVPEFNQADLKDQIIKGYYGENGYTGIHNLMATPSRKDDSTVYTITGQKVSDKTEQLPAGIYIRGGHKFVVR